MSDEVAERLMGKYDDRRRICTTVHHGDQDPRPPRPRRKIIRKPKTPFLPPI